MLTIDGMEVWLNELAKRNILHRVHVLAGVTTVRSLKVARKLMDTPGVYFPQATFERLQKADQAGNVAEEGVQIALELIARIKVYRPQGIHGIHIMPIGWHEIVPRVVEESGLTKAMI